MLCDNPEWDGVGGGSKVPEGKDMCVLTADLYRLLHGRNQHNIIKQLAFN